MTFQRYNGCVYPEFRIPQFRSPDSQKCCDQEGLSSILARFTHRIQRYNNGWVDVPWLRSPVGEKCRGSKVELLP